MPKFQIRRLCSTDFTEYYHLLNHFQSTIFTEYDFIKTLNSMQNTEIWAKYF